MSVPDSASPIWDFLHTGGPSSYDLQSPWNLDLNEHLRIFYPHEPRNCPCTNNLSAVLKPISKMSKNLNLVSQFRNTKAGGADLRIARTQALDQLAKPIFRSTLTLYSSRNRVKDRWTHLLKPVPLKKVAQIDTFALVNPKVSLCSARRGNQGRCSFRPNTTPAPASDRCRGAITYTT